MGRLSGKNIHRREVGPFVQWLRERMLGREMVSNRRFPDEMSDRTQPQPNLPDGPSHCLSANYYYLRDARRRVTGPLYIAGPEEQKKLTAGTNKEPTSIIPGASGSTPGKLYEPEIEPLRDINVSKPWLK